MPNTNPFFLSSLRPIFFSIKNILSVAFLFFLLNASAQEKGYIYGTIKDNNGITVPSATISIQNTRIYTTSDNNGNYRLAIPTDTLVTIIATFSNYKPFTKSLTVKPGEEKKIKIILYITELDGVSIYGTKNREDNMDIIDPKVAVKIPSPTMDIVGLVQSNIGVKSNNELSSAYSVRGGNFDENLVYVNDIEVYRPFLARSGQQEGLSFPNASLISSIIFSAGGFDAKYGDKMSSVLDIKYKKPVGTEASILLSLLGASAHYGSSSFNNKLKQITGIRFKTNQFLFGALETKGEYKPRFADLQSYWVYSLTDELSVSFLGNYANNLYQFEPRSRLTNFGSINQALRLSVLFSGREKTSYETYFGALNLEYVHNKLILKIITSGFQTIEQENFDILAQYRIDELERDLGSSEFGEAVNNIGIGGYLNHARNRVNANVRSVEHKGYYQNKSHNWKWGIKLQQEIIDDVLNEWEYIDSAGYSIPQQPSDVILLNNRIKVSNRIDSKRIKGFIQDSKEWILGNESKLILTAGARVSHWTYNNETLFSPRARISYSPKWTKQINDSTKLNRDLIFRVSGGYYYQQPFYREMRNVFGEVNPNIEAQRSIHIMAGADIIVQMWDRPFKIVSEGYYKKLDNLIPYKVEGVRLRYFATNNAKGVATGFDFKINGEFVKGVESWASFSYLKTFEDIFYITNSDGNIVAPSIHDDLSDGSNDRLYQGEIARPTDQRLGFSMFFQDELPKNPSYKVQLNLNFNSGLPFGPPGFDRYKDVFTTKAYQRVDIGFSKDIIKKNERVRSHKKSRIKEAWVSLEVFNLLNINNAQSYTWFRATDGRQYSVPNNLTSRILNLKLFAKF